MRTIEEIEKEMKLLQEEKDSIVKANAEKLENERISRLAEVQKAYDKFISLKEKYIDDYGYIQLNSKSVNNIDNLFDRFIKF